MCACGHVCVCTHMHEGATHSWGKNPQGGLEKAAFPRETRTPEAHAAPPQNTEALACRRVTVNSGQLCPHPAYHI